MPDDGAVEAQLQWGEGVLLLVTHERSGFRVVVHALGLHVAHVERPDDDPFQLQRASALVAGLAGAAVEGLHVAVRIAAVTVLGAAIVAGLGIASNAIAAAGVGLGAVVVARVPRTDPARFPRAAQRAPVGGIDVTVVTGLGATD